MAYLHANFLTVVDCGGQSGRCLGVGLDALAEFPASARQPVRLSKPGLTYTIGWSRSRMSIRQITVLIASCARRISTLCCRRLSRERCRRDLTP
jgi:hypothetical protein